MINYSSLKFLKSNIGFKISIASPLIIIKWSWRKINKNIISGQVSEPYTINFNKGIPELKGLFCEKIFGPTLSWQCKCNFFNNNNPIKYVCICPVCGFENNTSQVRKYRMGYIYLNNPVAHNWYLYDLIPYILKFSNNTLDYLIYYKFIEKNLVKNKILNAKFNISQLIFATEYIQFLLKSLNILNELLKIKSILLKNILNEKKKYYNKTINLLNLCITNNIQPNWTLLDVIPIIPVGLRPFIQLNNINFIISPLNELYKLIIIKNNRLKRLKSLRNKFPLSFEILEKRNLQRIVDKLLQYKEKKTLSSLLAHYQGKYNYFRQYILGKRVDFSGRSVITSGAGIPLNKIGFPVALSIQLYKPILLNLLKNNYFFNTLIRASHFIEYSPIVIKRLLKFLFKKEIIMVNRAPTLHRVNIQTYKPFLTENESIQLYPLACTGFNADFDGDQMGVFLILSKYTKKEAKKSIIFDKNLFSPSKQKNIFKYTQNSVLGLNTLLSFKGNNIKNLFFSSIEDLLNAYDHSLLKLNTVCCLKIKYCLYSTSKIIKKYIISSIGRLLIQNLI